MRPTVRIRKLKPILKNPNLTDKPAPAYTGSDGYRNLTSSWQPPKGEFGEEATSGLFLVARFGGSWACSNCTGRPKGLCYDRQRNLPGASERGNPRLERQKRQGSRSRVAPRTPTSGEGVRYDELLVKTSGMTGNPLVIGRGFPSRLGCLSPTRLRTEPLKGSSHRVDCQTHAHSRQYVWSAMPGSAAHKCRCVHLHPVIEYHSVWRFGRHDPNS